MTKGSRLPGREKVEQYKHSVASKPLVSVLVITYNQEKYIKKCLDSILSQKTGFDYEILLGEDESTDLTREICIEYANKHPDVIRLFLHTRENVINIGGKPSGRYNMLYNLSEVRGRYIALCEGDDYWTDENKLQKQVNFLEDNPDHALCFHPAKVAFDNKEADYLYPEEDNPKNFTLNKLLERNYIQTNTVMYRARQYSKWPEEIMPFDWYLHVFYAQFGKIGFINKPMSVYRRHSAGLWWGAQGNEHMVWDKYGLGHIKLFRAFYELFKDDKQKANIIYKNLAKAVRNVQVADTKTQHDQLTIISKETSDITKGVYLGFSQIVGDQESLIRELRKKVVKKEEAIVRRNQEIDKLKQISDNDLEVRAIYDKSRAIRILFRLISAISSRQVK